MTIAYLDTSAAVKLVFDEPESDPLQDHLALRSGEPLVASWLLHTELHCATNRRGVEASDRLIAVLARIDLVDLERSDLLTAGTLAPLRSQDAIHLAVALRLGADEMITYDRELREAATRAGLRALAPGT